VTWLLIIRIEEWLAVGLALLGTGLGAYFAADNNKDRMAYRSRGWNGFADLTAKIGIRSGLAKAWLHALLGVLPALGLLSPSPSSVRIVVALVFYGTLCAAQTLPISMQLLNERDRRRLHRGLVADFDATTRP